MEINHKFTHVEGSFETETGKLICVGNKKYGDVHLCFKSNMNIPFAQIKLYSRDLAIDADATFEDAEKLGDEICRRWNAFKEPEIEEPELTLAEKQATFNEVYKNCKHDQGLITGIHGEVSKCVICGKPWI